jgi:hypothetical protein
MANTYQLISSTTVSTAVSSITLSSIPATYKDLVVRTSTRSSYAANIVLGGLRFNGNSSSIYSDIELYYTAGAAANTLFSANNFMYTNYSSANTSTASTFGNNEIYIPNYAGSTNKPVSSTNVAENNSTDAGVAYIAGLWSSTAAITSITLFPGGGSNFATGSSFYLYGIKNS